MCQSLGPSVAFCSCSWTWCTSHQQAYLILALTKTRLVRKGGAKRGSSRVMVPWRCSESKFTNGNWTGEMHEDARSHTFKWKESKLSGVPNKGPVPEVVASEGCGKRRWLQPTDCCSQAFPLKVFEANGSGLAGQEKGPCISCSAINPRIVLMQAAWFKDRKSLSFRLCLRTLWLASLLVFWFVSFRFKSPVKSKSEFFRVSPFLKPWWTRWHGKYLRPILLKKKKSRLN